MGPSQCYLVFVCLLVVFRRAVRARECEKFGKTLLVAHKVCRCRNVVELNDAHVNMDNDDLGLRNEPLLSMLRAKAAGSLDPGNGLSRGMPLCILFHETSDLRLVEQDSPA